MKYFNPVTSSQRSLVLSNRNFLWKKEPVKSLTFPCNSKGGRNHWGRITSAGKFKGAKKLYRIIDFKRLIKGKAIISRIEYDPNRSAYIALIRYSNKKKVSYIIAPNNVRVGHIVESFKCKIQLGNVLQLKYIPIGYPIHNIEFKPNKGGQIARSAGVYAIIMSKSEKNALIKLCSGEIRMINIKSRATIGVVSNLENKNMKYGKAGRKFWLGFKPKVRGVAKNPVDHPHGGGEGKASGGRHPVTPYGKMTKGYKTRKNKRTNKFIVRSRSNCKK